MLSFILSFLFSFLAPGHRWTTPTKRRLVILFGRNSAIAVWPKHVCLSRHERNVTKNLHSCGKCFWSCWSLHTLMSGQMAENALLDSVKGLSCPEAHNCPCHFQKFRQAGFCQAGHVPEPAFGVPEWLCQSFVGCR